MPEPAAFQPWGASHLTVLALTLLIPAALILWARRDPSGRVEKRVRQALAALLAANILALVIIGLVRGENQWIDFLPMHLCDWLSFLMIAALLTKRQAAFEVSYFWGIAGTSQGVLTPDLQWAFPHPYFFTFHIGHSGILAAVAFLAFAGGMRPRRGSFLRAWLWLQVYALAAGLTNILLNENFGYLCAKPENPSLLDHLGPWPWYILSLQALALVLFLLLELPWRLGRIRESRSASPAAGDPGH